jgi:hypothetical protein
MDTQKVKVLNFDDVDHKDHPDYTSAYISEAEYNGIPMTEDQLNELNEDSDFVYEELMKFIY